MSKTMKLLLTLLCLVFVCIFAVSGYMLVSTLSEYKAAQNTYNKVSDEYVSQKPKATKAPQQQVEEEVEQIEESPIEVDFATMLAKTPNARGWLYSPDTVINYPLAQAEDNFYYLDRMIDGNYNGSGTLFLDCINAGDFSDRNTIIYGHNMNDGSMLHSIREYWQQEYYEAHPVMYLNTPTQNYKLELFSAYICDAESDTYTIYFVDDNSFVNYISKIRAQSDFSSDVEVSAQDRIVTLSTCTYEYDNARYVLHGKLVPIA